jgi:hypothetical protein
MNPVVAEVRVADEIFVAAALLHREHPDREGFTIGEIVHRSNRKTCMGK